MNGGNTYFRNRPDPLGTLEAGDYKVHLPDCGYLRRPVEDESLHGMTSAEVRNFVRRWRLCKSCLVPKESR